MFASLLQTYQTSYTHLNGMTLFHLVFTLILTNQKFFNFFHFRGIPVEIFFFVKCCSCCKFGHLEVPSGPLGHEPLSDTYLDAHWCLLTPPFGILKKSQETFEFYTFEEQNFTKKYFFSTGIPRKWKKLKKFWFVKIKVKTKWNSVIPFELV